MIDRDLADHDYETLATFRHELRRFLRFSERAAQAAGLTAQQYQALLAIRAAPDTMLLVGELAAQLLIRPHSATELVDRLERLYLIDRSHMTEDRRQVRVSLTEKAKTLLISLGASHRVELKRLGPLLSDLMAKL
jgi:DNA-binding MarR family transcriptional regulator